MTAVQTTSEPQLKQRMTRAEFEEKFFGFLKWASVAFFLIISAFALRHFLLGSSVPPPRMALAAVALVAGVLASIASVDLVISFDEDTPLETLEMLRPDLLFKGSDYEIEHVVGAELLHSYGGSVELIEIVPEQSTTRIVQKLRGV